jgi:prepilin-type processing-associated H-X9-DG protein
MILQSFPPPPPNKKWTVFTKESQISGSMGTSQTWVFIDVHPDTISSGVFGNVMTSSDSGTWFWKAEVPAKWHGNGCPIAFVDGHIEMHHWLYPQYIPDPNYSGKWSGSSYGAYSDPDVAWLSSHTSVAE